MCSYLQPSSLVHGLPALSPFAPVKGAEAHTGTPGLSRLMVCSVSGGAEHGGGSVVTIPTQAMLGVLQDAVGSGMRCLHLPQTGLWRGNPLWSPLVSQQL